MSLLDPKLRRQTGLEHETKLTGKAQPAPTTLLEETWRDFIFSEVWTRPGLDLRSRFWISIAAAAAANETPDRIDGYVRGALKLGEVSLSELREGALQLAVYNGWPRGAAMDQSVTRVAAELGLEPAVTPAIRAEPWDPAVRQAQGQAAFKAIMTMPGPPPTTAYQQGGILNFVFGEMWQRPGLDQRSRRWITLVGVSKTGETIPIRSHIHAAMKSGDATLEEMQEFVLQYAIYGGWPSGSTIQAAVLDQSERLARGENFQ